MERIEYRTKDKSNWKSRGVWDTEPDKIQWQDEATGLPCLIVRGPSGALCGYVGVAEGHPLYKLGYGDCMHPTTCTERTEDHSWCSHEVGSVLDVHGGITYADLCADTPEDRGICHKPAAGEPDHVWWLGFDCAHAGDFCPQYDELRRLNEPTGWGTRNEYRDVAYVTEQCGSLAKQLHAMAPPPPSR